MTESTPTPPPARWRAWIRPLLLAAALAALIVAATLLDVGQRVAELRDWIASLGALGPFVFTAIYIVAVVAAVPGSAVTGLAGALFGSVLGTVVVSVGSVAGATLCFLIARYIARDAIAGWLSGNARFARLDAMTERQGALIVAITRLVPLFPFNLLNYGFGLTRVRLWTFVFWSWLCMLPGTVAYVVLGDTLFTALAEGTIPWSLAAVLGAALALTLILARYMRRYLREKEASSGDGDTDSSA